MKFGIPAALASLGLALAVAAFSLAVPAEKGTADDVIPRAVLPLLSGDTADGFSTFATVTPTKTPATPTATPFPVGCSGPRSAIRTLSDSAAGFEREPADRALPSLINEEKPDSLSGARIEPFESEVVRVETWLTGSRGAAGGGRELLLANAPGDFQVVAGMVSGECALTAAEADQTALSMARVAYLTSCGPSTGAKTPVRVIVEGVPHWTYTSNGPVASIWPVLGFELAEGWTCSGQGPTPTPTTPPAPNIDNLYLQVTPQGVNPGESLTLTATTDPPGEGHTCTPHFFAPPDGLTRVDGVPGTGPKQTGADGRVSWTITIPLGTPLGKGSFQVVCNGGGGNAVKIEIG